MVWYGDLGGPFNNEVVVQRDPLNYNIFFPRKIFPNKASLIYI